MAFRALELGAAKWCKERIPRNGNLPTSEEGQALLHQQQLWKDNYGKTDRPFNGNFTLPGDHTFLLKRDIPIEEITTFSCTTMGQS